MKKHTALLLSFVVVGLFLGGCHSMEHQAKATADVAEAAAGDAVALPAGVRTIIDSTTTSSTRSMLRWATMSPLDERR